jgi:hypothetical protein
MLLRFVVCTNVLPHQCFLLIVLMCRVLLYAYNIYIISCSSYCTWSYTISSSVVAQIQHRFECGSTVSTSFIKNNIRRTGGIVDAAGVRVPTVLDRIFSRYGSYLLPQAYPEDSPTHASHPIGHATIAGACVAILKAFFDENFPIFSQYLILY